MEKYLIVTDTTSAMNKEIAAAHGIELISLSVIVDGQEYKDQVDISTEQLYDYLKDGILYNQEINSIGNVTILVGNEQMLGGLLLYGTA